MAPERFPAEEPPDMGLRLSPMPCTPGSPELSPRTQTSASGMYLAYVYIDPCVYV